MRPKISALLLAALLCLTAAGCGAGETGPQPPDPESPQRETVPPEETAPPPKETDPQDPAEQGLTLLETEELDGLQYGQTGEQVEELWGAPTEKTEPEIWATDGLTHAQWSYDGAALSFTEGALTSVKITAPRPGKTLAGVGLGSTAEEVRAAYVDHIDEESSTAERLVAGSIYGGLLFTLEDGVVTGVTLGIMAE